MTLITTNLIRRIEKSVYESGINVALKNAEDSKRASSMRSKLKNAIRHQISLVAKSRRIDNLLLFTKGGIIPPGLLTGITTILAKDTLKDLVNFGDFMHWAGGKGGQAALDKMGVQGTFVLKNPDLIQYFDDYSNLILDTIDETTTKWIAAKIQEGKDKLMTPYEITNLLVDGGKKITEYRARRIVITEVAKAMVTVEIEAAKRYGIREIIWRTSSDDRVDELCTSLEGKKIRIGETFPGGYAGPPAHVECRCFIEEVIPKEWELPADPWLGE